MQLLRKVFHFLSMKKYFLFRKYTVIKYSKYYLRTGLYVFNDNLKSMCSWKETKMPVKQIKNLVFIIGGKTNTTSSLDFGVGGGKIVLMNNDKAYAHYFSNDYFDYVKERYNQYSSLFNYPSLSSVEFIDDNVKKYQIMNRVYGSHKNDDKHDEIVISKLFEYLSKSVYKVNEYGTVVFIQHGDAKRENIIWLENDEFVFVDLDNIGYYSLYSINWGES